MSSLPDPAASVGAGARPHEGPSLESPAFVALRTAVAASLDRQAADIARRWERQAREVALRDEDPRVDGRSGATAVALVQSFAAALASDGVTTEDAVALGLAFGVEAFEGGASLHHMLKALELLGAMTMYAVESSVGGAKGGDVADGVRLCRRLQQGMSLVTLASTRGYTQAVSDGLRDRFRHLRHDLRNPLGTIKSVLALMDDETMPADARSHPRFRAMAERNARSLDELIMNRLSDAAALLPTRSQQRVSLRVIACGVRRDLRAEAEARDVSVLVADSRVRVCVDAVSLELMLHTMLLAALQESRDGDELNIDFGEPSGDRATLVLTRAPQRRPVSEPAASSRLAAMAARMGAKLTVGDALVLSVPVRHEDPVPVAGSARAPVPPSGAPRADVAAE